MMNDVSDYSRLMYSLEVALQRLSSCAVTTTAGDGLFIKSESFADLGSMPYAGFTANKYFSLQDGQIVILNDPFSGGTILSDITLVLGISLTRNSNADILLVNRIAFRPELDFNDTLKTDSFRIPPTPLGGIPGFTKEDVLKSIASAPRAPTTFKYTIDSQIEEMQKIALLLREIFVSIFGGVLKKATFEDFINFSQKTHHGFLDAIPFDRSQGHVLLEDGSPIHLSIHNTHQGVLFDFAGTQLSPLYGLTNPSVLGICLGALNSFLEIPLHINHGQFNNITVNTPSQSRLNSVFPQSTDLGHLMAAPQMANLILAVLSKLMPKQSVAAHSNSAFLDIQFANSRFFERLAGGLGATALRSGEDGWEIWGKHSLKASFEEIEKRFPIRIIKQERRDGSGGRGLKVGGQGLRRSFSVFESGRMRWTFDQTKPSGFAGGSAGDQAQIIYTPLGKEPVELSTRGEAQVHIGDIITILSSGGGGHGRQDSQSS